MMWRRDIGLPADSMRASSESRTSYGRDYTFVTYSFGGRSPAKGLMCAIVVFLLVFWVNESGISISCAYPDNSLFYALSVIRKKLYHADGLIQGVSGTMRGINRGEGESYLISSRICSA